MTRLRARIAERLLESQANNAILTTFNEVNMAPVIAMRSRYKDVFEKNPWREIRLHVLLCKSGDLCIKEISNLERIGRW